jgi:hypothetical protein
MCASETGLEIGEFRKIVHMVQKGEREARHAKKEMVEANLRLDRAEPVDSWRVSAARCSHRLTLKGDGLRKAEAKRQKLDAETAN